MRWRWIIGWVGVLLAQPPANDNCANGSFISFGSPHEPYAVGTFYSQVVDITHATLQAGEYVPPGVPNGKTVWYRFYLPTTRTVRIVLRQVGNTIDPTHAGWTLYRADACLPTSAQRVDPPIVLMEGYTHACLSRGWYMVQVGANLAASGQVFLELIVSPPSVSAGAEAEYDHMVTAQNLGVLTTSSSSVLVKDVAFDFACQSVSKGEAICDNDSSWSKSSWHVFRTDAHVDWVGIELAEDPWDNTDPSPREWRLFLYQGNALTDSAAGLTLIQGCIPLIQNNSTTSARYDWLCQLQPNTYYSIKILGRTTYANRVRLRLYERGSQPPISYNPLTIPITHQLGALTFGPTYTVNDYWGCQSRISSSPCGGLGSSVTPDDTIGDFDLALYYTFTLSGAAHVRFWYSEPWGWYYCMGGVRFRIFEGTPASNGCNLTLRAVVDNDGWANCLPAGTYTVQVLARINRSVLWNLCRSPYAALGLPVSFHMQLGSTPQQLFGLHNRPQEADAINGGLPLTPGVTYYAQWDTLDCRTTVLPAGDVCEPTNNRAIYRVVRVDQEGILEIGGGNWWRFRYRLYRGDARIEPIVGGRIQNLIDQVGCQDLYWPVKVCVTPGYYTLVSFGDDMDIGERDRPWFRFHVFPPGERRFYTPAAPVSLPGSPDPRPNVEEVGTIGGSTHSLTATWTRVTCENNPLTILGYPPCGGATKQFYWEVYIAEPSLITFSPQYAYVAWPELGITGWRTFRGRISDGSLTSLYRDCHGSYTACMEPGWYTFVAYAVGGTYTNPSYSNGRGGAIGNRIWFVISRDPRVQKYGTFATAHRPGNLDWVPHYTYAPNQHRSYALDWEFWSCANNLPFPSGITPCGAGQNRVSYRVFSVTRPSYLVIFQDGCYSSSRLYQGDITAMGPPYTIIHDCFSGTGRICWVPPGTYTLVTFASDACVGFTYTPTIYVDSVGYSLYNYAAQAYDFGVLPADNVEYRARPGDPLGPYGRPGSTDFIFCTTDAYATNPAANCPIGTINTAPAGDAPPTVLPNRRRNLWYTFVAGGNVRVHVRVYARTPGTTEQPAFAVYESDDPIAAFPSSVDSTLPDGLTLVASSQDYWWCCDQYSGVSFQRDGCKPPRRYYVVVYRNTCGKEPNIQIEVGVRLEPLPGGGVNYDHYSEANVITGNPTTQCDLPYTWAPLSAGTYMGCQGDLTCATKDPTDQNTCGTRTIWYAFESAITGYVFINYDRPGVSQYNFNPDDVQLYYQAVPGDSSATGLVRVPLTGVWQTHPDLGNRYWGRGCVRPGRYYLMFTGCNHLGLVVPRIWLQRHLGDFCQDSVSISVPSAGGPYSTNLTISCFTIGEGAGEADTIMACFGTPVGKKSAWVLVNNLTTDTMDFDVQIIENTTALGSQVLYRVLTGNCSMMNQEECVAEGTYITLHLKCRPPLKSFWIQVVLPEWATGDITVSVTANRIQQACVPPNPEKPRANFDFVNTCLGQTTQFLNYSSVGPDIQYYWTFGDGASSTHFQPQHTYAAADTYRVCLAVTNGIQSDTACRFLIIYPNPGVSVSMSPSSPVWVGVPIIFTPTYSDTVSGAGAAIYWNFCAGGSSGCGASQIDFLGPQPPPVSYSTSGRKRVCVTVTNGGLCDSTFCIEFDVILPPPRGGPYDGSASAVVTAACPTFSYVGGPYDGAAVAFRGSMCMLPVAGGPYDGSASAILVAGCPAWSYVGGPYDGAATSFVGSICWAVTQYTGGPYDGAAVASLVSCPPPVHPYAGGPYDGSADQIVIASCSLVSLNGGPYDGAATMFIGSTCLSPIAGGPYDGSATQVWVGACPGLSYAGGPYDGSATQIVLGGCVWPVAGGPYDGAATAFFNTLVASAKDTTVCAGSTVTLVAGGPSNWYLVPSGGTPVASNTSSLTISPLNHSQLYWLENSCTAQRVPVAAIALPQLNGQISVSPTPHCVGQPVTFTNQTLVSGTSQPSFGSLITSFGTHGTVPAASQLTFSSVQTANFSQLGDGIYQNGTAWTAGNSGAGTQWAMWRYPIPRSVNRIVFWACQSCPNAAQRLPRYARLYYNDGSGWKLAKAFSFAPGTYVYDSGIFTETQVIFAQLWRLELDVSAANAPSFGEFQVYSSSPVIGGHVQWSCDGGNTWTAGNSHSCTWSTPGTKTITMVVNAPGACPDTVQQTVSIANCGPLPAIQSILAAYPTSQAHVRLLWQTNVPIEYAVLEKKTDTGWTAIYRHEVRGATTFGWIDSFPTFEGNNLYRVVSEHGVGQLIYSNVAEVRFAEGGEAVEEFLRAFPNPVTEQLTVQFGVSTEAYISIRVYDARGALVAYLTPEQYKAGLHEKKIDTRSWATGVYTLQFLKGEREHTLKLLKIVP
ncbi:MAG: PKD domain-containing protein [Bacteroidia bacterium]|nr:PKD domain-containing protein [Bacteroidia bacterium]